MNSKSIISCSSLYLVLVILINIPSNKSKLNYTKTADYPFLVLVEVKRRGGFEEYCNGVLASLTWVLTLSKYLAQEKDGKVSRDLTITVYAGLSSFRDKSSAKNKGQVHKISTDLGSGEKNEDFPNLVLLKVDNAFSSSRNLQAAKFNIGKLSMEDNILLGWIRSKKGGPPFKPVSLKVSMLGMTRCRAVKTAKEQLCFITDDPDKTNLKDKLLGGALLLNEKAITALQLGNLQYGDLIIMIMVRLYHYRAWLDFNVIEPNAETATVKGDFFDYNAEYDEIVKKETHRSEGTVVFSIFFFTISLTLLSVYRRIFF